MEVKRGKRKERDRITKQVMEGDSKGSNGRDEQREEEQREKKKE